MYLSIQPKAYLMVAIFWVLTVQLSAQDNVCSLSPPAAVRILTSSSEYFSFSWEPDAAAVAYEVVVIDDEGGHLVYHEITEASLAEIPNMQFAEHTVIGISAICENQQNGAFGYFLYESNSTIIVQDIVMQMQGENNPRTLECEVEKTVLQSTVFTGGITSSFSISPPFNASGSYQVQGAIVDVTIYDQTSGVTFAQATMLGLSNSTLINAANQTNVTSTGAVYEFVSPANQGFFDYSTPVMGEFDFFVDAIVPTGSTFQLVVGQRICFNVNKVNRKGERTPLQSGQGPQDSDQNLRQKVTETAGLLLYPNPSTDYIRFGRAAQKVIIRNQNGQVVYSANDFPAQAHIPTRNLSSGVYYFEATTVKGDTETIRFVKS